MLKGLCFEYLYLYVLNFTLDLNCKILPLGGSESQFFFVIDSLTVVSSVKSVAGFETSMSSKTCLLFGKRPFF